MRAVVKSLNTTIPGAESKYVGRLKDLIVEHRLIERVGQAHTLLSSASKTCAGGAIPYLLSQGHPETERAGRLERGGTTRTLSLCC